MADLLRHLVLPAVTLAARSTGVVARMTRSSLLEVIGQDYVKTARAKGLPEFRVIFKHALKNGLIPVVTVLGVQFGVLLGRAVVVETVFAWPGLGWLIVRSVLQRDFPLVQAGILLAAVAFVAINLTVDLLYAYLDPLHQLQLTEPSRQGRKNVAIQERSSLAGGVVTATSVPADRRSWVRRFLRHRLGVAAAMLLLMAGALLLAAPLLPLRDPNRTVIADRLQPPLQKGYLLGTDALGRDMLSRLIWGGRVSLLIGAVAAGTSLMVGAALGVAAGFFGGRLDRVLSGLTDVVLAFPYILLGIGVVAALGPSLFNAMLAVSLTGFPVYMRVTRAAVLSVKQREFVQGAAALGAHPLGIVVRHIMPNSLAPILVTFSTDVGEKVIATASLSFLGLGVQPPQADWGNMLATAMNQVTTAPHVALLPGAAIFVVVLCCNLLGDALRDALDPRLR